MYILLTNMQIEFHNECLIITSKYSDSIHESENWVREGTMLIKRP